MACVCLQIQAESEQCQEAGLKQEQDHRSLLRDIVEQQKETESQAEDYEQQASIVSEILDKIKTGLGTIRILFQNIEHLMNVIEFKIFRLCQRRQCFGLKRFPLMLSS